MHCPVCGREIPENSRYCPYCNAYVKNAPQQKEEEPVYSEQYLRTEARIDAMRRKNRRQRRLMNFIIFLILLIIAAVAISYGVDRLREHFAVEITTESEADTTEPLTAPPTTEAPTDHFDPARESFAELTETFSGMIGSLASEYDLTAVPADEGYGSYAYTMDALRGAAAPLPPGCGRFAAISSRYCPADPITPTANCRRFWAIT